MNFQNLTRITISYLLISFFYQLTFSMSLQEISLFNHVLYNNDNNEIKCLYRGLDNNEIKNLSLISKNALDETSLTQNDIDILNKHKLLVTCAIHPNKKENLKSLYENRFIIGLLDLEYIDPVVMESLEDIFSKRLDQNKLLIIAKVITSNCETNQNEQEIGQEEISGKLPEKLPGKLNVSFYECYNLLYYIFKKNFFDCLKGKNITDSEFCDFNKCPIKEPITLYYMANYDVPKLEFLCHINSKGILMANIPGDRQKICYDKTILKTLFIANLPNELIKMSCSDYSDYKISQEKQLKQQLIFAILISHGCSNPKIDIDQFKANKLLQGIKNQITDEHVFIIFKWKAFLALQKKRAILLNNFNDIINNYKMLIESLSDLDNQEFQLDFRFYLAQVLFNNLENRNESKENLEIIINSTKNELLRKKALELNDQIISMESSKKE